MIAKTVSRLILFLVLALSLSGCYPVESGQLFMTAFDVFGAPVSYDDSGATKRLRVAATSIESDGNNKDACLEAIRAMVDRIKKDHDDIDVIVFGEQVLGKLYLEENGEAYQRSLAEAIPGSSTDYVANLAHQNQVVIVFGMAELDDGKIYNSQAIVFPNGEVLKYRKRGLNPWDKLHGFSPGSEVVTTTINGILVTFMICSDYANEAVIREVGWSDAKVVLMSLGDQLWLSTTVNYNARQVNKWLVYANRYDPDSGFSGLCFVADPVGALRASAEGNGVYSYYDLGVY